MNRLKKDLLKRIKEKIFMTPIYNVYAYIKYAMYPIILKMNNIDVSTPKKYSNKIKNDKKIIVSLTTIPQRINKLYKVIRTILNQDYKPDLVVLYLSKMQFTVNDIPKRLKALENNHFIIKFVEDDLKSYKKLYYALIDFPNDIVITADDDLYYPKDWISTLYNSYKLSSNTIWCHMIKKLGIIDKKIREVETQNSNNDFLNGILSGSGALFPPNSLNKEFFNKKFFIDYISTNDDIWFWAMAILNGTKIKQPKKSIKKYYWIEWSQEKTNCLWKVNSKNDNKVFNEQLDILVEKYRLLPRIMEGENCGQNIS